MSSHSSGLSAQELLRDFLPGNELSPLCCNNYFEGSGRRVSSAYSPPAGGNERRSVWLRRSSLSLF